MLQHNKTPQKETVQPLKGAAPFLQGNTSLCASAGCGWFFFDCAPLLLLFPARPAALDSHGALFWGYCNVTRNKAKNLSRQWRDFRFVARTDIFDIMWWVCNHHKTWKSSFMGNEEGSTPPDKKQEYFFVACRHVGAISAELRKSSPLMRLLFRDSSWNFPGTAVGSY